MASFALPYLSFPVLRRKLSRAAWAGLASASVWRIANYVIALATFPYLARTLGVAGFGVFGLGAAIAACAQLLTHWGFALTGTQQATRLRGHRAPPEQKRPLLILIHLTLSARPAERERAKAFRHVARLCAGLGEDR